MEEEEFQDQLKEDEMYDYKFDDFSQDDYGEETKKMYYEISKLYDGMKDGRKTAKTRERDRLEAETLERRRDLLSVFLKNEQPVDKAYARAQLLDLRNEISEYQAKLNKARAGHKKAEYIATIKKLSRLYAMLRPYIVIEPRKNPKLGKNLKKQGKYWKNKNNEASSSILNVATTAVWGIGKVTSGVADGTVSTVKGAGKVVSGTVGATTTVLKGSAQAAVATGEGTISAVSWGYKKTMELGSWLTSSSKPKIDLNPPGDDSPDELILHRDEFTVDSDDSFEEEKTDAILARKTLEYHKKNEELVREQEENKRRIEEVLREKEEIRKQKEEVAREVEEKKRLEASASNQKFWDNFNSFSKEEKEKSIQRITAEKERQDKEDIRQQTEDDRQKKELLRQKQESIRQALETKRQKEESTRQHYWDTFVREKEAWVCDIQKNLEDTFNSLTEDYKKSQNSRWENDEERQNAEESRIENEVQRIKNEEERVANEKKRLKAEQKRVIAEEKRMGNENSRIANEKERFESEEKRWTAENNRAKNEQERIRLEKLRISDEKKRMDNELKRSQFFNKLIRRYEIFTKQTSGFQKSEVDRKDAEKNRDEQEFTREENEGQRVNQELQREKNELSRKQAEEQRKETFLSNEDKRQKEYEKAEKERQKYFQNQKVKIVRENIELKTFVEPVLSDEEQAVEWIEDEEFKKKVFDILADIDGEKKSPETYKNALLQAVDEFDDNLVESSWKTLVLDEKEKFKWGQTFNLLKTFLIEHNLVISPDDKNFYDFFQKNVKVTTTPKTGEMNGFEYKSKKIITRKKDKTFRSVNPQFQEFLSDIQSLQKDANAVMTEELGVYSWAETNEEFSKDYIRALREEQKDMIRNTARGEEMIDLKDFNDINSEIKLIRENKKFKFRPTIWKKTVGGYISRFARFVKNMLLKYKVKILLGLLGLAISTASGLSIQSYIRQIQEKLNEVSKKITKKLDGLKLGVVKTIVAGIIAFLSSIPIRLLSGFFLPILSFLNIFIISFGTALLWVFGGLHYFTSGFSFFLEIFSFQLWGETPNEEKLEIFSQESGLPPDEILEKYFSKDKLYDSIIAKILSYPVWGSSKFIDFGWKIFEKVFYAIFPYLVVVIILFFLLVLRINGTI